MPSESWLPNWWADERGNTRRLRALLLLSWGILSAACPALSQKTTGVVTDEQGDPLYAVQVICKSDSSKGALTDLSGKFSLELTGCGDTLCFYYLGFESRCVAVNMSSKAPIVLRGGVLGLREVVVTAKDPISEKFSVVKLEKLEIYQNPVSAGDPLKAITIVPASTNADETADPALRGSSADRSRVLLNGIPIRNPVRNGQFNGLGNFSLFNTELVEKLYIYASNPPLTFSNTSAGAVDIQTRSELSENEIQVSAGLAAAGVMVQHKLGDIGFMQGFANRQFSDGFLALNPGAARLLHRFGNVDAGLNIRLHSGPKSYFNSYNYAIDEFYNARLNLLAFQDNLSAGKFRAFSANNWVRSLPKGNVGFSYLYDYSNQYFDYGNMQVRQRAFISYYALDYKQFVGNNISFQSGICYNHARHVSNSRLPRSFFNLSDASAVFQWDSTLVLHNPEFYLYANYEGSPQWGATAAYRTGIPLASGQMWYHSYQASFRYRPHAKHSFIVGAGRYHNYSTPGLFVRTFNLLNSTQLALDYELTWNKKLQLAAAVYVKNEGGFQQDNAFLTVGNARSWGLEWAMRSNPAKYIELGLANTFLRRRLFLEDYDFPAPNSFNYFLKAFFQYNNPALCTAGITLVARPGQFYTPVAGADFDPALNIFVPRFSTELNSAQYDEYINVSLSLSKYIPLGNKSIVVFASVNNLLNRFNPASEWYERDYSQRFFDPYQMRTVYFGVVAMLRKP